jgi:hypothetical protein
MGSEMQDLIYQQSKRLAQLASNLHETAVRFANADQESVAHFTAMNEDLRAWTAQLGLLTSEGAITWGRLSSFLLWLMQRTGLARSESPGSSTSVHASSSRRPTPTYPAPTPTPTTEQSPTPSPTSTPTATPSATATPTQTPSPSPTPTERPILPTNTPGTVVFSSEDLPDQVAHVIDEFIDSFSLVPDPNDPPILYPDDLVSSLETNPITAPYVPYIRGVLTALATLRDLFEPFRKLDPTYPLTEPVPQGSTSSNPAPPDRT